MDKTTVATVIAAGGGSQAVADALGISRQAVEKWHKIPPLRVLKLEKLTGIPRYVMRPDFYPREDAVGRLEQIQKRLRSKDGDVRAIR